MTDQCQGVISRCPRQGPSSGTGLAWLLAAYHLRTEAEKGAAVADVDGLPERWRIWTDPAFPGRGVASRLIDAALARSAASGVRTVRLSEWKRRVGAIAPYERLGAV
ncbi:GNAT family N-acetyltransferase [Streptomyces sp. NPDC005409]|uniref:GNAT family N-acetyltransferase n=1 Tax=Streptomyces sp. NPDC005409 TaxID=3155342 RepID=UPI003452B580